jgi:hypothetical protein
MKQARHLAPARGGLLPGEGVIYVSKFTTRVQLNGTPSWDDYNNLHAAMRSKGFTQTIESDDEIEYHLPHAEYNREGTMTRNQVLEDAKQAAASVWDDSSILVTESAGRTWHNLRKVDARSSAYRP